MEESVGPGVPRSFQWVPPSDVSMTWEPTAMHDVVLTQETPLSALTPAGGVWVVQVPPPLLVPRIATPGPPEDEPTAVQSAWLEHETAVKLATVPGIVSCDHDAPPLVVAMMLGEAEPNLLTAWHVDALTQSTPVRTPTPEGTGSVVQVAPPFDVPITMGLPKMPKPTAVQSESDGQVIPFSPLTVAGIG
jgi:hypothetical protein